MNVISVKDLLPFATCTLTRLKRNLIIKGLYRALRVYVHV